MMNGREKSDSAVVATKPANKVGKPAAEWVEPRAGTKGNTEQTNTCRAQDRESVSQALDRIRQVARQRKKERFTSLFHHISVDLLEEAFCELKRNAAPGTDGLTWQGYEADLERNLEDLHARLHRGAYRALPSRRVYIPKPDGRQRPLAVTALEDKIVQRATAALLNAIYEEEFLGFSYGFRPGRGTHDALDALIVGINSRKVNWIFDADIRSFFDSVSWEWLIRFVEHRIKDSRIIRLIQKWLKAGVLEDGVVTVSDRGTGQGSVISPLLANIYLHYAFDLWAERWRRREAVGDVIIVRYADDLVVGFEHESDARRFWDTMRERLQEFSLSLHPDKTRLIEFGRHAAANRKRRGLGKPETFNFLGFTVFCGKSRRAGSYVGEILKGPSQPQPKMFGTFLIKKATSADENVGGHLNAERLRRFEIDDQLGFGRLLHRQVGRLFAVENTRRVSADRAISFNHAHCIAHEPASLNDLAVEIDRWYCMVGCRVASRSRRARKVGSPLTRSAPACCAMRVAKA